jgi:UDP:flavonoid glycosyltransferase YjiC (YdhE family)
MRSVLFAWELGSGLGHVLRIKRLAARLAPHGIRLVGAIRNLAVAHLLAEDGVEVLQSPIWPGSLGDASGFAGSSATCGDRLAAAGLADLKVLTAITAAWDHTLALVDPDLVVADYAPGAMLAARGRLPLAVVGNGFTVPPAEMQTFPLLHNVSPPLRQEAEILGAVNTVLQARKTPLLDRLPQMFSGDICSVQTFPILDPYRDQRVVPVDGPILAMPEPRRRDAQTIFVYIADGRAIRRDVFDALIPLGVRLRVFGPELTADATDELSKAGATVEARPLRLESELAAARLLIHFGGLGVASAALAAGVPQLVLGVDIEKELNGQALERAGVGRLVKIQDPAADISSYLIEELAHDDSVSARAFALAEDCRIQMRQLDPLGRFESQSLAVLNRQPADRTPR